MMVKWLSIPCSRKELCLEITLSCGQSFRWKEILPGIWRSVLRGKIWTLKQTEDTLFYQVSTFDTDGVTKASPTVSCENSDSQAVLSDYFQLDVPLSKLYGRWSSADKNFAEKGASLAGVRILRQDPVENLFSFICSSNNNISRISGMVGKLCDRYGTSVGRLDGEEWHNFPSVSRLAGPDTEAELRKLGFGYRAKFIHRTAQILAGERGGDWLCELRKLPYADAHTALRTLAGVGAKVADCVCLFSLDKPGAIPVDTHVWQIACRDYMPELRSKKSLTDKTYKDIGNFFRDLFGDYAGWAHSVLFSADLKKFNTTAERVEKHGAETDGDASVVTKKKRRKAAPKNEATAIKEI